MKLRSQETRPHHPSRPRDLFFATSPHPSDRASSPPFFQPKLQVGEPGDRFEREADQVADQVVAQGTAPPVQTMCAECAGEEDQEFHRQLDEERQEPAGAASATELEQRLSSSRHGGLPLPSPLERSMSAAFGRDFSSVRVHTDGPAAQLSRDLQAKAFTQGSDIFFNEGNFAPESTAGRRLLAHELTHVVQQGFAGPSPDQPIQRDLLRGNGDCDKTTDLPIDETASVPSGANFTETFSRPATGRVRVTVTATADPDTCHPDATFGVDVWQCHIVTDEPIESQHIAPIGETISYRIILLFAEWNTYEKYYVRIYTHCAVDLDVKVEEVR